MTKWTAPDIASIRGDNSRPLQKIFGSLTEYLKDTLSQTTEVSQTYVRNGEATTLTVGTVVYLDAQQGDRATVKRAYNTSDATSAKTLGVVAENIPANSDGLVTTLGYLEKVNTSAFTAGQTLYLGSTAGTFTATKPVAPNHMVYVGVVVRANAGNGIIYVRCQNGYELDEIHDVLITSPATGNILMRNGSNLWINTPQTSITSVGTLGSLIVTGDVTVDTNTLRVDSTNNRVGIGTSSPSTALQVAGTVTATAFAGPLTGNVTGNVSGSAATVTGASQTAITALGTLTSLSVNGSNVGSPVATIGDWNQDDRFTAFRSQYGYLLLGSTSVPNANIYLRTETASGTVIIGGGANQNVMTVGATDVTMSGGMNAYSIRGNANVAGTGNASYHPSGIYSTGTNWLYGTVLTNGSNIGSVTQYVGSVYANAWFRSAAATGWYSETFGGGIYMEDSTYVRVYNGKRFFSPGGYAGNVQFGSYGAMTLWGTNNGYTGIANPDTSSTIMWQNGAYGAIFGHYKNDNAWNFYVGNGTFVPSDARYKRDIEPLQHGMNLIREIVPVTYDPLTENSDDDPEETIGKTHYGFTTQNILQALTNVGETRDVAVVDIGGPDNVSAMGSDRQYLNHSALMAPMVKAIQELDARLQQLETV